MAWASTILAFVSAILWFAGAWVRIPTGFDTDAARAEADRFAVIGQETHLTPRMSGRLPLSTKPTLVRRASSSGLDPIGRRRSDGIVDDRVCG